MVTNPEKTSTKPVEIPKESTQAKLDELQEQLNNTQDNKERTRIRSEIFAIKRSYNRTKQFTEISGNKLAE